MKTESTADRPRTDLLRLLGQTEAKARRHVGEFLALLESLAEIRGGRAAGWLRLLEYASGHPATCALRASAHWLPKSFRLRECRTFWGRPIRVVLQEYPPGILECGYPFVSPELRLTKFMIRALAPGDDVIDAGAYIGFYTLLASELVGDSGRVHAFEPHPDVFRVLSSNVAGRANVRLRRAALSDRAEPARDFYQCREDATGSTFFPATGAHPYLKIFPRTFRKYSVEAVTLDEYCRRHGVRPALIKIDVEGAEALVLKGGGGVIESCGPVVCMEMWTKLDERHAEAATWLEARGYRAHRILQDGQLAPAGIAADASEASLEDHDNVVFARPRDGA